MNRKPCLLSVLILIVVAFASCDSRMQGMMKPVVEEEVIVDPFADVPRITGADAFSQDYITGPWLWMIAPTEPGHGGAASIDIDSLAVASDSAVSEVDVATKGVAEGDTIGDFTWMPGKIAEPPALNNIGDVVVNELGWATGRYLEDRSSYALISLVSDKEQSDLTMQVGSDDAIKVWLNGEVVHKNPVNRTGFGFQDEFKVDLKMGDNLLLVKVSNRGADWAMFVGIQDPQDDTTTDPEQVMQNN